MSKAIQLAVTTAKELTPREKRAFKALSIPAIVSGMIILGLSGWLGWLQYVKVAQWPRTHAMLTSKRISDVGARMEFRYTVMGRQVDAVAFRWGPETALRKSLSTYEPGTIHEISYDPSDPSQVETMLTYNWELFKGAIIGALFYLPIGRAPFLDPAAQVSDLRFGDPARPEAYQNKYTHPPFVRG